MIRLRVERFSADELSDPSQSAKNGLMWYADGQNVGRVVIEQTNNPYYKEALGIQEWTPVEVLK